MKNGILVTLVFLMLVSGIILPVIINKASAVPSTTLAGVSSVGKCNEGTSSAIFKPHYAIVMPDKPNISVNGKIMETHVSNEDFYFDHNSHDSNFKVLLDDKFYNLNSQSNSKLDNQSNSKLAGKLLMEMEWEIGTANDGRTDRFPKEFWPFDGDFVSAEGRYIFDCGHVTNGPLTEIHPPSAVAFTRFEPMIFKLSKFSGTDPLLASQISIFINGAGGVFVPDIKKLNNPDLNLLGSLAKLALTKEQAARRQQF